MKHVPFQQRLASIAEREGPDACWLWPGSTKGRKGYGSSSVTEGGKVRVFLTHREAWEVLRGPVPDGLVIDHLCRRPACMNPAHMELVTRGENVMRGVGFAARNGRKTHCANGHEFTPENTEQKIDKKGRTSRACVVCRVAAQKRYYERNREAVLQRHSEYHRRRGKFIRKGRWQGA